MKSIITVKEARKILGKDAAELNDDEVSDIIETLDLMAKDALETARTKIRMKKDAMAMANLIYDIYRDKKAAEKD